jgi:hypothetical protein
MRTAKQSGLTQFVSEDDLESGKIDLRLVTARRLEAHLKPWRRRWTQIAQDVGHRSVAACIPALARLSSQPTSSQARTLTRRRDERINHSLAGFTRSVDR